MKKMIVVVIVLACLILLSSLYGLFFGIKSPNKYLKEKYPNIKFKYISNYDSGKDWQKYHYKDENGEDVSVSCNKKFCRDNYYGIYNKEKIDKFIYDELKKIDSLNVEYKYGNCQNNGTTSENVTLDTPVVDVIKIDDGYQFTGPVDIYVKDEVMLREEDFKVFKDANIEIRVYLVSNEDYNLFDVDYNNYIYDYIEKTSISIGINNKYTFIFTRSKLLLSV